MGNNFLLPVIANHPWVAATPCTCGRRITNQAHLGVHAEQTEVNDTLHNEVVSCSLGGSSTCRNKMVPNSPFSCSAFCCGFFFEKLCCRIGKSDIFAVNLARQLRTCDDTLNIFLSLIYMKLNLPSHSHTTMIDYKVFSIIVLQMGVN
jgi:hypothetical protein